MIETAAIFACILLASLAAFQIALIAGAPLGRFAWGGRSTFLPTRLRIGSAISILLYAVFAIVILNQSGLISLFVTDGPAALALNIITGYFFLGIIMNAVSRSRPERFVMTPVASLLALSFLFVALEVR